MRNFFNKIYFLNIFIFGYALFLTIPILALEESERQDVKIAFTQFTNLLPALEEDFIKNPEATFFNKVKSSKIFPDNPLAKIYARGGEKKEALVEYINRLVSKYYARKQKTEYDKFLKRFNQAQDASAALDALSDTPPRQPKSPKPKLPEPITPQSHKSPLTPISSPLNLQLSPEYQEKIKEREAKKKAFFGDRFSPRQPLPADKYDQTSELVTFHFPKEQMIEGAELSKRPEEIPEPSIIGTTDNSNPNDVIKTPKRAKVPRILPRKKILEMLVASNAISSEKSEELEANLALIDRFMDKIKSEEPCTLENLNLKEEKQLKLYEVAKVAKTVELIRSKKDKIIRPRDVQLIAVLLYLDKNPLVDNMQNDDLHRMLLEMSTGEGKSLTQAMIAILVHRWHNIAFPVRNRHEKLYNREKLNEIPLRVKIIPPTTDLAEAGYRENALLYAKCNIKAGVVDEKYKGRNSDSYKDQDTGFDVTYATISTLLGFSLQDATVSADRTLREKRLAMVDEVDTLLKDSAAFRLKRNDPDPLAKEVQTYLNKIAQGVKSFYQGQTEPLQSFRERLEENVAKESLLFQIRWQSDKESWFNNAIMAFDPKSLFQEDKGYIVRFSFEEQCESLKQALGQRSYHDVAAQVEEMEVLIGSIKRNQELLKSAQSAQEKEHHTMAIFSFKKNIAEKIEKLEGFNIEIAKTKDQSHLHALLRKFLSISKGIKDYCLGQQPILKPMDPLLRAKIVYWDQKTGMENEKMIYEGGLQEFLEIKHFGKISRTPTSSVRTYSMKRYIDESASVLGLSGTIGLKDQDFVDYYRKTWRFNKIIKLPRFANRQLNFEGISYVSATNDQGELKSEEQLKQEWLAEIQKDVSMKLDNSQPVLVIAENPGAGIEIYKHLLPNLKSDKCPNGINYHTYFRSEEDHVLDTDLSICTVVMASNLGGRGSDYSINQEQAPNGLHALTTFCSNDMRINKQAWSRAARSGMPGSAKAICISTKKDQRKANEIRKSMLKANTYDFTLEVLSILTNVIGSFMEQGQGTAGSNTKDMFKSIVQNWMNNKAESIKILNIIREARLETQSTVSSKILSVFLRYLEANKAKIEQPYLQKIAALNLGDLQRDVEKLGYTLKENGGGELNTVYEADGSVKKNHPEKVKEYLRNKTNIGTLNRNMHSKLAPFTAAIKLIDPTCTQDNTPSRSYAEVLKALDINMAPIFRARFNDIIGFPKAPEEGEQKQ